jgi:hypothetical protein
MAFNRNLIDVSSSSNFSHFQNISKNKEVNLLIPGFNNGIYNNPRKRYPGIHSFKTMLQNPKASPTAPRLNKSAAAASVDPAKMNPLFGYGARIYRNNIGSFAEKFRARQKDPFFFNPPINRAEVYDKEYYKLPYTHNHNPITNPMPKNIQNPYMARALDAAARKNPGASQLIEQLTAKNN